MATYIIGDFIRETRIRKGYTQEEVSYGICTLASLSRIENGMQAPGRYILDKLMERLGMENSVFNVFVSKEEMELYERVQEMVRNMADGNFEELERQIQKVEDMTRKTSQLERQYLYFAKAELLRHKKGKSEEVTELLLKAVHITLPQFDGKTPLYDNLLTFDEIMIINAIAVQYAENHKEEDSLKLGYWLKQYMEQRILDSRQKAAKYPVIVYDISNWLALGQQYEQAYKVCNEGVAFCVKYGNLVMLPLLIYNKACSLAELNRKDEAKKYFTQSVTLFEIMKLDEKACRAADWCKSHYGIEL